MENILTMPDTSTDMKEYADAAGLKETDMPSAHHPLMQNDDDIRNLGDLVDARDDRTRNDIDAAQLVNENDLDIEEALTFPHKKHEPTSAELTPTVTSFDGDARTKSPADDATDTAYMGRADFDEEMLLTDPDPEAGNDAADTMGEGEGRAVDITGTATGIARGMATHLPQDLGADGFQIEEPEMSGDPRATEPDDSTDDPENDSAVQDATPGYGDPDSVGGQIPVTPSNPASAEEELDATRQEK